MTGAISGRPWSMNKRAHPVHRNGSSPDPTRARSECGRRAEENSSDGTDHGAAGTSLLIGSRVNGGMIGEFPALSALDVNGNQRVNVDFQGVYASLLEQWFDHDVGAIIPGASKFQRYKLLA